MVIAAITSCTNTSNPYVMMGAGLLAQKAVKRGLKVRPWVKTSLAPGSQVVTDYLKKAGVDKALDKLGFTLAGYGCTTCIGNSGPLPDAVAKAIDEADLVAAAVISGNRNFEGRVHPQVRANYLASPMLVVAYALAGSVNMDLTKEPVGYDKKNEPVYLKDIWPSPKEIADAIRKAVKASSFKKRYGNVFDGDANWKKVKLVKGQTYQWDMGSTYVKNPPYFDGMKIEPAPVKEIAGARVLALFGDSITTDHISPAGNIKATAPAGIYLQERQVAQKDFNSYGSRRGNHEVMERGTFANIRIRNEMMGGKEGGNTIYYRDVKGDGQADVDLRRGPALQEGRPGHHRDRRQGIWHRLVARLGGQGSQAAGRARRHHRKLRAHPPLQPDRHGRGAVLFRGRQEPQGLRLHRPRDRRYSGPVRRHQAAHAGRSHHPSPRRQRPKSCRWC